MIVYRYTPYQPDEDPKRNVDQLMSLLSEFVIRYDMELEDALKEIIQKGYPVNLFLKEGGWEDLLKDFIEKLKNQKKNILNTYEIQTALEAVDKEIKENSRLLQKKLKKFPEFLKKFEEAIENRSFDQMNLLKWEIFKNTKITNSNLIEDFNFNINLIEEYNFILEGLKKYQFKGKISLNKKEAIELIKFLEELERLMQNLETALQNGDIYNFDLEKISKYLGAESYEEFLKRREQILEKLTKILETQGRIIRNEEGKLQLSPYSLKKIGKKFLEEIYRHLKADFSNGFLITKEEGEGDQVIPETKEYQFGNSISHIDFVNSILNAYIRTKNPKPRSMDLEVFKSRGFAKSSIVILLDMSGSMFRSDRFYYAKKMILALETLIREEFKEDSLFIVGFGTFANIYSIGEIPKLQPFPVTLFDPYIRLKIDLTKRNHSKLGIPEYFTNLQKGLELSRRLLNTKQTQNKQIILITDGVPTAHTEGNHLFINYPPAPSDFDFALKEAIYCKEEGITINTFLLTNDWNIHFFEGRSFIYDFASKTKGRIFYPHPSELGKIVLADFIEEKRKLIS
ncbi:MAG: hypothetical protein ACK4UJ_00195 [Leptonema sp. (in: bacteria)]